MDKASQCISRPLKHLQEEIDTTNVVTLTNIVQRESALIRESRKIVDREEANVEALVRAYLLTKDEKYYREGINRLSEILSWQKSKYFAGDFNLSTLLSMSTSAYDGFIIYCHRKKSNCCWITSAKLEISSIMNT